MTTLSALLSEIDAGTLVLPEFQRGYVWNREQVRGLMRSLYLYYPVGGFLVWETKAGSTGIRHGASSPDSVRSLLLDGQQRVTTLYGVIRGRPPEFFEGDPASFSGLRFNVETESFEFYGPVKMKDDPLWVDVTDLFRHDLPPLITRFNTPEHAHRLPDYLTRLSRLRGILDREFHIDKIVGADKTTDVVVDIFNRVNSGGTKLSKGDLALAKVAAGSPEARQLMRAQLSRWATAGYSFSLEWLLRNITAVATGKAAFASLDTVDSRSFGRAFTQAVDYIDTVLNLLADRLGLDHGRVLLSRYAIPVLTRYLHLHAGRFPSLAERDKALYWYVHAGLWGRFSGATETKLQQDYGTVGDAGLEGLIASLATSRGGVLTVNPDDFTGYGVGARFYPMLYLLTRVHAARDLGSDLALRATLLGRLSSLQVHHLFPKALLYDVGYPRGLVNAVANFVFLTQQSNLRISKTPPTIYFPEVMSRWPGALESQWIPTDPTLWEIERYPAFLAERRRLLAGAANSYLESLLNGAAAQDGDLPRGQEVTLDEPDPRAGEIDVLLLELREHAVVTPQRDTEVADPNTGEGLAVAEAFWPEGLQPGRGEPVVLELDPEAEKVARLQALGYRVFTSVDSLRRYVEREAAADAGVLEMSDSLT